MRKTLFTHLFIWFVVLGFAFTTVAQDNSIGKVPTTTENPTVNYSISLDAPTSVATAYGHAGILGQFVSMPIPAGDPFTQIGAMAAGGFFGSAEFGPGGTYYLIEQVNAELYTVDLATGATTLVGSTGVGLTGLTYDWSTDTFFGVSTTDLYTVDVTTGATTLVGSLGAAGLFIDVAADCDGLLYGYDLTDDNFYSIDPATGAATIIGALGYDANFGQGMSYDHSTGILYLSAFNNGTFTGQLRSVDVATGNTTLVFDWGFEQVAPFAIDQTCGAPCTVGDPSNPNPADGTVDVPVNLSEISWTNTPEATEIEVFFGPVGSVVSVYLGTPTTSFALSGLDYSTDYMWYVKQSDGNCWITGPAWTFTTAADPDILLAFMDDFEDQTLVNWTITNDGGTCDWTPIELATRPYTMPPDALGWGMTADSDLCGSGTTLLSTATMTTGVDATQGPGYNTVWIEWDNDWRTIQAADEAYVEVSFDGGSTWSEVTSWLGVDQRETHENWEILGGGLQPDIRVRFRVIQPGWDWWWTVDNFAIYFTDPVPVELTSFAASVNESDVILKWTTATELNNMGFEVQRASGGEYAVIGFIDGNGTTSAPRDYTFTDKNLNVGSYTYRLKQVDFDGTSEFSDVVEVEVLTPDVFALEQNYPNPFNPSTMIKFSLAADSKVTLKVFDVLGQEVATLISGNLAAGSHEFNFDASNLNSGVYFYRIDATGVDGTNFNSVKKMTLTK